MNQNYKKILQRSTDNADNKSTFIFVIAFHNEYWVWDQDPDCMKPTSPKHIIIISIEGSGWVGLGDGTGRQRHEGTFSEDLEGGGWGSRIKG